MRQNHYVIRGGKDGRERLRVLARVMQPGTTEFFERVGVQSGWSCLDIGCGGGDVTLELAKLVGPLGQVTGIDSDPEIIEIAQKEAAERQWSNVSFQHSDVTDFRASSPVDMVYCRFLLTHLPDPARALERMMGLLKPGGVLAVEDIDFSGHICYPESAAFFRYVDLYSRIVRKRGGDPDIGPRLPSLLFDTKYTNIQVHVEQPVALTGETKVVASLTWQYIADKLVADGLSTPAEIESVANALDEFAANPRTLLSQPRVMQVWGYRSATDSAND